MVGRSEASDRPTGTEDPEETQASKTKVSQGADWTATDASGGTTDKQRTIKFMLSVVTDLYPAEFASCKSVIPP